MFFFVWISEKAVIIYLCGIKGLIFVTEREFVYSAVRIMSLYIRTNNTVDGFNV